MSSSLRTIALRMGRLPIGGDLVAALSRWLPGVLPFRVAVLPHLVVLRHPVPMAAVHLLAIPRKRIRDVTTRDRLAGAFWSDLEDWLRSHGAAHGVGVGITNIGVRQDVRLLHVHLVADPPSWSSTMQWSGRTLPEVMAVVREHLHDQEAVSGSVAFTMISGSAIEAAFDPA